MKIREVIGNDAEKLAVDNLKQKAKSAQQQDQSAGAVEDEERAATVGQCPASSADSEVMELARLVKLSNNTISVCLYSTKADLDTILLLYYFLDFVL